MPIYYACIVLCCRLCYTNYFVMHSTDESLKVNTNYLALHSTATLTNVC